MIGLIDCRPQNAGTNWTGSPLEQLEFFDRSLLQHAVEQMVQIGVTQCVLITENPAQYIDRWGNGERWGCSLKAIKPSEITGYLAFLEDGLVLVGCCDCIPLLTNHIGDDLSKLRPLLFFHNRAAGHSYARVFTGWAVSSPQMLLSHCFATQGAKGLLKSSGRIPVTSSEYISLCIRSMTPELFLESQQLVLENLAPDVIFNAFEIRPGVWVGRGVDLHPDAVITGRSFLGDNVRIERDVHLSGHTVVCRDSVVGAGAVVSNTSIQPCTFAGRAAQLDHDVAFPGSIVNSQEGIRVKVTDPRLLANTRMTLLDCGRMLWKALTRKSDTRRPGPSRSLSNRQPNDD